jgi:hypothetical protein
MPNSEAFMAAWEEFHWEFTLAFEGLSDSDLWRRAHPSLLSIGELAGHVAYCEGLAAQGAVESPLLDSAFSYYSNQIGNPVLLDLTVAQVLHEVKKVHDAVKAGLASVEHFDEKVPWRDDMTWGHWLRYQLFHVSYHCGQAYSVRHLMGHETTDN